MTKTQNFTKLFLHSTKYSSKFVSLSFVIFRLLNFHLMNFFFIPFFLFLVDKFALANTNWVQIALAKDTATL